MNFGAPFVTSPVTGTGAVRIEVTWAPQAHRPAHIAQAAQAVQQSLSPRVSVSMLYLMYTIVSIVYLMYTCRADAS